MEKETYLYSETLDFLEKREFDVALKNLNLLLEISPKNAKYHIIRGLVYEELGKLDASFADFSTAIKIDKNDSNAYHYRGGIRVKFEDYKNAINDYSIAISINPQDASVFNSRGITYSVLKKYESAKKDFQTAFKLDEGNKKRLLNLGLVCINAKEFKDAINYFSVLDSLDLNHEELQQYLYFRAYALFCEGEFEKTLSDLNKAIEFGKNNKDLHYLIGLTYSSLNDYKKSEEVFQSVRATTHDIFLTFGEKEASLMLDAQMHFENANIFKSILNKFGIDSIQNSSYSKYKQIHLKTIKTISLLHVDSLHDNVVAHYTKKDTVEKMLFADSKFRMSTVLTANDPEEGKVLLDYLYFNRPEVSRGSEYDNCNDDYQAFIGSFTFNHDSLNQYRLYGKLNEKEATGVSIVFNQSFFNRNMTDSNHAYFKVDNTLISDSNTDNTNIKKENNESSLEKHALYRCVYIDPITNQIISIGHREEYTFYRSNDFKINPEMCRKNVDEYEKIIKSKLKKVKSSFAEIKKILADESLDINIVKELVIMLSYLTKHMAFKEEQECRILSIEQLKDNAEILPTKLDGKPEIDFSNMYIEYLTIKEHVRNIYFAPKTLGFQIFKDQIQRFGLNVNCAKCSHPFS